VKNAHAGKWYRGLQPGGTFRSKYDGKLYRWLDTSGAKDPHNEDRYRGHKGASIHYEQHIHFNGDANPDSVKKALADSHRNFIERMKRAEREDFRRAIV